MKCNVASGGTFATISPSRPQRSGSPNTSKRMRRVPSKRETLEKLKTSPFFVSIGYPKPDAIHTDTAHLMCSPEPSGESGLSYSGSMASKSKPTHGMRRSTSVDKQIDSSEKTGPINWSVEDLASKYRDETNREEAYRVSIEAQALQAEMARKNVIIGAVHVVRHPLLVFCDKHILDENRRCLGRARMHGHRCQDVPIV